MKIPACLAIRRGAPACAPRDRAATQGRPYGCMQSSVAVASRRIMETWWLVCFPAFTTKTPRHQESLKGPRYNAGIHLPQLLSRAWFLFEVDGAQGRTYT